jgi:hypothetical protein
MVSAAAVWTFVLWWFIADVQGVENERKWLVLLFGTANGLIVL